MSLEASLQKAIVRSTKDPVKVPKKKAAKSRVAKPAKKAKKAASPKRGRGGHIESVNPWTKRLTLDITPEQNTFLATFAIEHETKKNPILRALIGLMMENSDLSKQVSERLDSSSGADY